MTPRAQVINLDRLKVLRRGLGSLVAIDFSPLMLRWEDVLVEDNRKGVLEGTDGWGRAMPPLVYRNGAGKKTAGRKGDVRGSTEKRFKGRSDYEFYNPKFLERSKPGISRPRKPRDKDRKTYAVQAGPRKAGAVILPNNNLSTAAYQRLTGPRLAPRRDASRVITNYETRHGHDAQSWFAEGSWRDVLTPTGDELLPIHFNGTGAAPKYDLRHVRPWGITEAGKRLRAFVHRKIQRFKDGTPYFETGWSQYRMK
jgi:hypothetical protein